MAISTDIEVAHIMRFANSSRHILLLCTVHYEKRYPIVPLLPGAMITSYKHKKTKEARECDALYWRRADEMSLPLYRPSRAP